MQVYRLFLVAATCWAAVEVFAAGPQSTPLGPAKQALEKGDSAKAVEILRAAETKDPNNGDIELLLTKAYLELDQYDAAVGSAERAVAIDPTSSEYHQWLGEAYGAKADHAELILLPIHRKTVSAREP